MPKQLSVLHVIDSLNVGGTERQCVETVKRLNGDQISTHLVTLRKASGLENELVGTGIPVTQLEMTGGYYRPKSLLKILKFASFMRKNRFDVVQTYGFYSMIPGVIAAKMAGVPVVIAGKRCMSKFLSRPKIEAEKMLWHFCDSIIVNAGQIKHYLVNDESIDETKITLIHNGVDLDAFNVLENGPEIAEKKPVVGMVAVFRPQKDHVTFLKAAKLVLAQRPDVAFSLVGSGALEDKMKAFARELGIQNHVTFHGRKTGKALIDIMSRFTVSVLSSTNEGTPNVLLEAMALHLPVISNPSGSIRDLVQEGVTGYLFPYKDADYLAKKIHYLIDNKTVSDQMGNAGRKRVEEKFSYSSMCQKYEALYDRLFQSKKGER